MSSPTDPAEPSDTSDPFQPTLSEPSPQRPYNPSSLICPPFFGGTGAFALFAGRWSAFRALHWAAYPA